MFKFLKEKLKSAVSVFSRKVEEEVAEEPKEAKPGKKKEAKEKKPAKEKRGKPAKEKAGKKKEPKKPARKDKPQAEAERRAKEKGEKAAEEAGKKEAEKQEQVLDEEKEDIKGEFEGRKEKKSFFGKLKEAFSKPKEEKKAEEKAEELEEEIEEQVEEKAGEKGEDEEEKKGFFKKVSDAFTTKTLSESKFEEIFWELEVALLESNVALSVIEKIKEDMKAELVEKKLRRSALAETVASSLRKGIDDVLSQEQLDFFSEIKKKQPFVICFFGINGSGKTTSIAKLANILKKKGFSCVLAAADTFRAAAIDQLQKHGDRIGVKVIRQEYGADAAAVAYDAIEYAKAKRVDVVLIDTAGRSHSNVNLMDELKKIIRVANPDMKIFVGDSLTGNDMVEQAQKYAETTGIDGIILAKADVDEKGGATISAAYVTKKPVIFIGTGQGYDDLEEFDKAKVILNLGLA